MFFIVPETDPDLFILLARLKGRDLFICYNVALLEIFVLVDLDLFGDLNPRIRFTN